VRVNAHHATELRHILPLVTEMEVAGLTNVGLVVTPEAP
jgi:biopolymer transport protein ExbD